MQSHILKEFNLSSVQMLFKCIFITYNVFSKVQLILHQSDKDD